MLTAIVGINWGDEGKGRMVDLLSKDYDIICRYQGGNNAGHTVINEKGKFILNLLPSGILRETTVNIMGNGMVIDLEHLVNEMRSLTDKGIHSYGRFAPYGYLTGKSKRYPGVEKYYRHRLSSRTDRLRANHDMAQNVRYSARSVHNRYEYLFV